MAEIPANNANSPFALMESLTTVALGLAMDLMKPLLGVPLKWIVQAIMCLKNGDIVHHHACMSYKHFTFLGVIIFSLFNYFSIFSADKVCFIQQLLF